MQVFGSHESVRLLILYAHVIDVDSFHNVAHPTIRTVEIHGALRSVVCISCGKKYLRKDFQRKLYALNPAWAEFLEKMLRTGALRTDHPVERAKGGLGTNPDGDFDLPNAPYTTFRYPSCENCLLLSSSSDSSFFGGVKVDSDGAWLPMSTAGILKPDVVMFGESIPAETKALTDEIIDRAEKVIVIGSSLATYSAWRLAKRAKDNSTPLAIINIGGVRGERDLFNNVPRTNTGDFAVRCAERAEIILPRLADAFHAMDDTTRRSGNAHTMP